ncbi:DEAD/DEAH box helicase [Microbacterium betulae]|uniref:DEAD/DEAH box helicase n=1 Tax=Microbacterium betulae TaxID=2981139 RepID=A0AA97FI24_9MICO|nr:DEAD/DEAH box helicase [Microbacterium sp. AB]WOF22685.1 DEAD/DEAH box helicase [Microbacterium sp. AB]
MPKNKKPAGGRPAQNFDPRYAKKRTGGPFRGNDSGSRGPRRDEAGRPARADDRSGGPRREGGYERREGGYAGPRRESAGSGRFDRDDRRPARDDRAGRPAFNRDDRGGRPPYNRDDRRPARDDRPAYNRDDRAGRPAFNRDDRGGRPAFNRDDRRPARDDRPAYNRDDRAGRPAFNRDDRGGRPAFNRDDRGGRPAFNRDDRRPARDDRPAYNRDDRGGRPAFNRDDRGGRPAFNRDDRAGRPSFDRDDRRPSGADRPRFSRDDRPASNRGARPAYDRDARPARDSRPAFARDDRPRRDDFRRDERPARSAAQEQQIDVVHERLEAQAIQATDVAEVSFGDLGLGDNIERALAELGAPRPFPIQAATIPPIIEGRDVLARGRTGSGKTIAFGAALVERVLRQKAGQKREFGRSPVALILAPTRELALQIDRTVQPIARSVGLFTTQIYGGVPQGRQVGALKKGVDIVIGTPGRIEDLQAQGKLDLSQIGVAVLDEADHMCELGFLEPVQRILRLTADGSQRLLFSATLDREVAALVDEFLVNPAVYEVAGETQETSTIEHHVLVIDQRSKSDILDQLVDREGKTLVFSRTRAYAEQLAEQFEDAGLTAVALHGDLNQAKRTRNIEKFAKGRAQVLVATDVAARGIHVDDIDLVVQADAPTEYKTYLHRAGRTGRAGREGRVVTLVTRQRQRKMDDLLRRAEIDAPFDQVRPGDELISELTGGPTVADLTA